MPIGLRCVNGLTVTVQESTIHDALAPHQRTALRAFEGLTMEKGYRYRIARVVGSGAFSKVFLAFRFPVDGTNLSASQSSCKSPSSSFPPTPPSSSPSGTFAFTLEGEEKGGLPFAVKMVSDDQISAAEILAGMTLDHRHIAGMEEYVWVERHYFIVYEYVPGCNMQVLLDRAGARFSEDSIRPVCVELLGALDYCHRKGVVHRDLKPENLLLDQTTGKLKLVDFGLCFFQRSPALPAGSPQQYIRKRDGKGKLWKVSLFARCPLTAENRDCGTPLFAAPEIFLDPRLSPDHLAATDFYSFGITLYCLLIGDFPYQNQVFEFLLAFRRQLVRDQLWNPSTDVWTLRASQIQRLKRMIGQAFQRPEFLSLSPEAQDLLLRLIEPIPQLRITWKQIYSHPWIRLGLCELQYERVVSSFSSSLDLDGADSSEMMLLPPTTNPMRITSDLTHSLPLSRYHHTTPAVEYIESSGAMLSPFSSSSSASTPPNDSPDVEPE